MSGPGAISSVLIAGAAAVVLIAIVTAALTGVAALVFSLQAGTYRRGIVAFLKPQRTQIYTERGLAPSKRFLRQMTKEEALQIIHAGVAGRTRLPRGAVDLRRRIAAACLHPDVLADFRGAERQRIIGRLDEALVRIEARWRQRIQRWCFGVATGVTIGLGLSMRAEFGAGEASHFIARHILGGGYLTTAVAVLLLAVPSALIAAVMVRRYVSNAALGDDVPPAAPPRTAPSHPCAKIGRAGAPVRAINFGSGGFDTFMHLGVTHALLVIQGRAPDVVVGLSAGAIHAVALADVLQAGDDAEKKFFAAAARERAREATPRGGPRQWTDLSPSEQGQLQQLRMLARVERLRHFIEHAQRAPERLLDAILPDTYQIEAGRPLQPLQQPRLSAEEREARRRFVETRSGLARLYNDVLNIPLSVATLTKVLRRALGYVATADIPQLARRWAVRAVEISRLWILLGANLFSAAKLLYVLGRAFFAPRAAKAATAATLIFRSRVWGAFARAFFYALVFVGLLVLWLLSSILALPLLVGVAIVLMFSVVRRRSNAKLHLVDAVKGIFLLFGLTLVWLIAILAATAAVAWACGATPDDVSAFFRGITPVRPVRAWAIAVSVGGGLIVIGRRIYMWLASNPQSLSEKFLGSYGLADAIFRDHGLRSYLAEIIDPNYYARAGMNRAVEAALNDRASCPPPAAQPTDASQQPRILADFCNPERRLPNECIHVGVAVANTESGALEAVPSHTSLVDALMAATAITPWLPPVELERPDENRELRKVLYIDGANVSQEPTHTLLKLLRAHRNPQAKHAYIYSVSAFPVSQNETGEALSSIEGEREERNEGGQEDLPGRRFHEYLDLMDIVWRALRLQRFRDAGLERRLTELFTSAIPSSVPAFTVPAGDDQPAQTFFRAWVTPVDLEYDADLNRRLYRCAKSDRRRLIAESIADGCRASLQVMIARSALPSADAPLPSAPITMHCRAAVQAHFRRTGWIQPLDDLPGSNPKLGPGLSEICAHCTLHRPRVGEPPPVTAEVGQHLRFRVWQSIGPDWPHERQQHEPEVDANARFVRPPDSDEDAALKAWQTYATSASTRRDGWPAARAVEKSPVCAPPVNEGAQRNRNNQSPPLNEAPQSRSGHERALISLLFSGGVFRGVYQVGVLNALKDLHIEPDVIAGASVGSITAAMIAEAFSLRSNVDARVRIARLAAVYLSVDRLILTDRFADFVRTFTLRAAETRFSIRQADRLLRRYDQPRFGEFDRNARRVIAGIERLFYVTPYHLNAIVRAFREGNTSQLTVLLNDAIQRFLDRMQVGDQALGAEALRELIDFYVVGDKTSRSEHPVGLTIDRLRGLQRIAFLATTTNITRGRLEVLGSVPNPQDGSAPVLVESLLASSAFPGVFRPRWSWEVTPGARQVHQYIDGGVMDNLPVDAIANYLHRAARARVIAAHPPAPHLIIGASLQVRAPSYALAFTRNRFRNSWFALRKRATQLGYNTKLDKYRYTEQALCRIHAYALKTHPQEPNVRDSELVSMHLLPIKPDWLCGTFAFHPMLGFRRARQAQSIAHGCATTLLEFARLKQQVPQALRHWGVCSEKIPQVSSWHDALERAAPAQALASGECWLRPGCTCPFSRGALMAHNTQLEQDWSVFEQRGAAGAAGAQETGEIRKPKEQPLEEAVIREVSKIHRECVRRETHLRRI